MKHIVLLTCPIRIAALIWSVNSAWCSPISGSGDVSHKLLLLPKRWDSRIDQWVELLAKARKSQTCWEPPVGMRSSLDSLLLLIQQASGSGGLFNRMARCPCGTIKQSCDHARNCARVCSSLDQFSMKMSLHLYWTGATHSISGPCCSMVCSYTYVILSRMRSQLLWCRCWIGYLFCRQVKQGSPRADQLRHYTSWWSLLLLEARVNKMRSSYFQPKHAMTRIWT